MEQQLIMPVVAVEEANVRAPETPSPRQLVDKAGAAEETVLPAIKRLVQQTLVVVQVDVLMAEPHLTVVPAW
tara:strand:- start:241 stop:456 length:216 start_codon:yes stop_codon:yes gene_type:complete